jgi:hypothetical protein
MSSSSSSADDDDDDHNHHNNHEEIINTPPSSSTNTTGEGDDETSNINNIISKNDLIELVKAVKFANPEYSQRDVYKEIVNEIPIKFPQYTSSINESTVKLNDVKKVWKKAVLNVNQQQQQQKDNATNNNKNANANANANNDNDNDLAERLRKMNTTPEVYTIGVSNGDNGGSSNTTTTTTSGSAAKEYIELYLKQLVKKETEKSRLILEDYVHVYLDVPADSSGSKPHQALINFQNTNKSSTCSSSSSTNDNKKKQTSGSKGNKKKGRGNNKKTTTAATTAVAAVVETLPAPALPFDDAIIIKIQMAAPLSNEQETIIKHPMLLYDKERKYKTFIHPNSTLTSSSVSNNNSDSNNIDDGYTKISNWINTNGIGGVLGSSGGTKAYFYSRLTTTTPSETNNNNNQQLRILSIYVKELAPSKQEW